MDNRLFTLKIKIALSNRQAMHPGNTSLSTEEAEQAKATRAFRQKCALPATLHVERQTLLLDPQALTEEAKETFRLTGPGG